MKLWLIDHVFKLRHHFVFQLMFSLSIELQTQLKHFSHFKVRHFPRSSPFYRLKAIITRHLSLFSRIEKKFSFFRFFRSVRTHLSSSKVRELDCLIDGWVDNKLSDISRATFSQIHLSGTNNLKWPNCEGRWKLFVK